MSGSWTYTGFWIDWTHGRVPGLVLTLHQRHAGYLQAFLAILVTFAGSQLWKICAFVLHRHGANGDLQRRELIHHQQQVILRGSQTAGHTFLDLASLVWNWKGRTRGVVHCVVPAVVALLIVTIFPIAGIFTGEIAKSAGNATLIRSNQCGLWQPGDDLNSYETTSVYAQKALLDTLTAADYAANCYGGSTSSSVSCNSFLQTAIPYNIHHNVSCPFDDSVCIGGESAAVSFDTGLLDSHLVFGINAPPEHRVSYRRHTTCSPLVFGSRFCRAENSTVPGAGVTDTFIRCYTGPTENSNHTFAFDTHNYYIGTNGYELSAYYAPAGLAPTTWDPIPELNRTDADVSLFYLTQNSVGYYRPVNDPFFSAHQAENSVFGGSRSSLQNISLYVRDAWIDALGCIDQHQICNAHPENQTDPVCTSLTSLQGLQQAMAAPASNVQSSYLSMNLHQLATAIRIDEAVYQWTMASVVVARGASALKASQILVGLESPGLPDDQWVVETVNWFKVSLAAMQSTIVQYAAGPSTSSGQVQAPVDPHSAAECKTQLVRNAGSHQNFSVLGLAIVLALSCFIILVSLTLQPLCKYLFDTGPYGRWHERLWRTEDKLHLQRLAYEGAGWTDCWQERHKTVPRAAKGEMFGHVTVVDDVLAGKVPAGRTRLDADAAAHPNKQDHERLMVGVQEYELDKRTSGS